MRFVVALGFVAATVTYALADGPTPETQLSSCRVMRSELADAEDRAWMTATVLKAENDKLKAENDKLKAEATRSKAK